MDNPRIIPAGVRHDRRSEALATRDLDLLDGLRVTWAVSPELAWYITRAGTTDGVVKLQTLDGHLTEYAAWSDIEVYRAASE